MNEPATPIPWLRYLLPAGLAFLTLAVYWNAHTFSFINFDDDLYIYTNAMTLRGLTPDSIAWALTSLEVYNWHPMAWLSHMADVELFGLDAGMHHMTSVVFHILNAALLFVFLYTTTRSVWKSAFVAAVFALHPMHVESVAWVSERKDVLSLFFMLLASLSYVRYTRYRDATSYILTALLFIFALMSKPIAVVLPLLFVAFDIWPLRRFRFTAPAVDTGGHPAPAAGWKTVFMEKAVFFTLSIAAGIVTIIAQGRGGAISDVQTLSIWGRIAHSAVSYVQYLGKMFFPTDLSFYYLYGSSPGWEQAAVSVMALAAITAGAVMLVRYKPYLLGGWLVFLFALFPVIGILQAGAQAMADRYTYIPLIGIAAIVAWGVSDAAQRLRVPGGALVAAGSVCIAVLAWMTHAQVQTWENNRTLYTHAIEVDPANSLAYNNLGTHYLGRNKLDSARMYFRRAAHVNPEYAMPLYNLGLAEQLSGNDSAAAQYYKRAIALKPGHADAHLNLGAAYSELGRYDAAVEAFRHALELSPLSPQVHYQLGVMYYRTGELGKAATHLRGAIDLNPLQCEPYLAYARVLYAQGNARGAEIKLEEARRAGCSDAAVSGVRSEARSADTTRAAR